MWGLVGRVPGAFPYTDCSVQPASRRSMSSTFDPNESLFANAWIKTDVSPNEESHAPCHPSLAVLWWQPCCSVASRRVRMCECSREWVGGIGVFGVGPRASGGDRTHVHSFSERLGQR